MAKMGRPTKFSKEIADTIVKVVSAGNYIETAAAFAGIDKTTVYDWLKRGARGESQELIDFSNAVRKADAEAEINDIETIGNASKTDWKAAAWRRERRNYERWGRKTRVDVDGQLDHTHADLAKLTPEEFEAQKLAFLKRNQARVRQALAEAKALQAIGQDDEDEEKDEE